MYYVYKLDARIAVEDGEPIQEELARFKGRWDAEAYASSKSEEYGSVGGVILLVVTEGQLVKAERGKHK